MEDYGNGQFHVKLTSNAVCLLLSLAALEHLHWVASTNMH